MEGKDNTLYTVHCREHDNCDVAFYVFGFELSNREALVQRMYEMHDVEDIIQRMLENQPEGEPIE